jgi:hypothetical protein
LPTSPAGSFLRGRLGARGWVKAIRRAAMIKPRAIAIRATDAVPQTEMSMFLETVGESDATGRTAELYGAQKTQMGFVMAALRCWTTRPDLLALYKDFSDGIRAGFSLSARDWRLITLVAAKQVHLLLACLRPAADRRA